MSRSLSREPVRSDAQPSPALGGVTVYRDFNASIYILTHRVHREIQKVHLQPSGINMGVERCVLGKEMSSCYT